jgi:phytoene synthase
MSSSASRPWWEPSLAVSAGELPTSTPAAGASIRKHSRSFSFASRLLPADIRADVEKLYAWCRWCDDGVDAASSGTEAVAFVELATEDLRRIADGHMPHATESRWLAALVRRHGISLPAAEALLAGIRSDLAPAIDFSVEDLMRYGFRVAGSVGVMMCPILGLRDRRFLPHAAALGMGMQLTNIARDVAEDWRRSRCYLPVAWTGGLRPGNGDPDPERVRGGVAAILDTADGYYAAGETGIDALDRGSRLAVLTASRVYRAIGTTIRKRGFDVLETRARVSTLEKARLFGISILTRAVPRRRARLDDAALRALENAEDLLHEHGVIS